MECLEWHEDFCVGVNQMDEEHIALFALFNDVCAVVEEGGPPQEAEALLQTLLIEAREHSASEERLLASTGFPGLSGHASHHRELNTLLKKYIDGFDRGKTGRTEAMLIFLRQWLTGHILNEDLAYGAWIRSHHSPNESLRTLG